MINSNRGREALPAAWHEGLKAPARAETAQHPPVEWERQEAPRDQWHPKALENVQKAAEIVKADRGSRHDRMTKVTASLVRQERNGYTGASSALDAVVELWVEHMADERRAQGVSARAEILDMIGSARAKVARTPSTYMSDDKVDAMFGGGSRDDADDGDDENDDENDDDENDDDENDDDESDDDDGEPRDGKVAFGGKRQSLIGKGGLRSASAGSAVLAEGPIRPAPDGRLWAHTGGVWRPGGDTEVNRRLVGLLGQKYRPSYVKTVTDWLRAQPMIDPGAIDPTTINVADGLLDWRTGQLRPHDPEHHSTVQLPVRWNPDAQCPRIDRFLNEVAPGLSDFLDEVIGYTVAPGNPLHRAVLLLGGGRQGKGTFLRMVEALIGSVNCASITPHQIADNRFAAASLYGRQANIAGDLEARLIERTDTFKMLTGGDTISAEHKYGQSFTFRSHATMLFSANEPPAVRDHSEGFYSRWIIVPFEQTIPPEKRIPEHILDRRLRANTELEGLLARAVAGLRRLMDRGDFDPPDPVRQAGEAFRVATDPIAAWLEERTVVHPDGFSPRRSVAYESYRNWCFENGRKPVGSATFYNRVRAVPGVDDHKRGGVRGFLGLIVDPAGVHRGLDAGL